MTKFTNSLPSRRWLNARMSRRDLLATVLLAVAGCSYSILPELQEPTDLYSLRPKTRFPDDLPSVDWQLVVELPTAAAGIDGSRIALSHDPYVLEYYAKAAWTDNAPGMVRSLLVESFERCGKVAAVGTEAAGLRANYVLKTSLRKFQADYRGGDPVPEVIVRISTKLLAMPERRIVRAFTSEKSVRASGTAFKDVLGAFNDALGHVMQDIVVSTLTPPAPVG
jgi:cholesterol transport system auxiliary component